MSRYLISCRSGISPFTGVICRWFRKDVKIRSTDPPYLSRKPPMPVYEALQLDVKSKDFVVLERYFDYIRSIIRKLRLNSHGFPLPASQKTYKLYHPNSTKVRDEFELSDYHRVYRVQNLKAIHLPILVDLFYQNLPEGVELSVSQVDVNADEARFVPQLEVYALKGELSKLSN